MSLTSLLLLLIVVICGVNCDVVCRDENNNPVDWYYVYKLPKSKYHQNPLIKKGEAYMFITAKTIKSGWKLSDVSIKSPMSIPGLTLSPLYKGLNNTIQLIYNDQPFNITGRVEYKTNIFSLKKNKTKTKRAVITVPEKNVTGSSKKKDKNDLNSNGHTKGVLMGDSANSIWLVHSVPKFPPTPGNARNLSYSYPKTGTKYGQSFLCMSINTPDLNKVGMQLTYNEPKIVYSQIPCGWLKKFPYIAKVINKDTVKTKPWTNEVLLRTKKSVTFLSFAKSGNFKKDLYQALVSEKLQTNLLTETWINGPGVLESNCTSKYKVHNIENVSFSDVDLSFSSHTDHSKWAVSIPNKTDVNWIRRSTWLCVGDINRAQAQEHRGGGTVCLQNYDMWSSYNDLISSIQPCKKDRNKIVFQRRDMFSSKKHKSKALGFN